MATATIGDTGRSARIRAIGIVVGVLLALTLAIAVSLCAIFVHAAHTALPQVDGSISLAGLGGPVTVIRDARGVPHIQARNADDLFFAQGYVTAQDRLWQMDMSRRYSAGELAEILGPSYLGIDEQQRILRLRPAAEKESAALSAGDRQHFEAYARGVNAYIAEHRDRLPLEFRVLRYAPRT